MDHLSGAAQLEADIQGGSYDVTMRVENVLSGELGVLSEAMTNVEVTAAPVFIDQIDFGDEGFENLYAHGTSQSTDDTPDITLDITGVEAGDTLELIVDGETISITAPTSDQLTNDSYKLDNFDLNTVDQLQDKSVSLAVKVTKIGGEEFVSDVDLYTWQ